LCTDSADYLTYYTANTYNTICKKLMLNGYGLLSFCSFAAEFPIYAKLEYSKNSPMYYNMVLFEPGVEAAITGTIKSFFFNTIIAYKRPNKIFFYNRDKSGWVDFDYMQHVEIGLETGIRL